ncbi:condensin-2 complex subunit H2 isoform X2 [Dunckerocampus dactyliophorus]|uniref:condensin-2 complex subunit H2 isoform X2 n=1 Tax=Dunckerocampus dactyliophorus TaxID=161453 RepID=UPI00240601F3|nr:condensin-2 complex subunit H2 isoform X2 [Dunckerocampus dactyliophorus]
MPVHVYHEIAQYLNCYFNVEKLLHRSATWRSYALMEATESRFAHLLKPIRELTDNWDIDLASELNDYLEELDEMCITFDGKTRLDFAEAALLIQGSASIYSKKVELLHSLVYRTLEYINDRNKKRSKQATTCEDADTDEATSKEDEFSLVDINVTDTSDKADMNTPVKVTPLPPESLIAPENHDKQKLPLISVKGEIVCSQKDFWINLFLPGHRDMILLNQGAKSSTPHLDQNLQLVAMSVGANFGDIAEESVPPVDDVMDVEQEAEEHVERQQAPSEPRMIRPRQQVVAEEAELPAVTAWTLHDPYATELNKKGEKAIKLGKCYEVPAGLDDGGKRKRKRAAPLQDFCRWFKRNYDPPDSKLRKGPTFIDLNYVYLSTIKSKLSSRKRINRKQGVFVTDGELTRNLLQLEEVGPHDHEAEPVEGFIELDMAEDLCEHEQLPVECEAEEDGVPGAQLTYEDLVKLRVEQLVINCQGYVQETALSRRVKDWEDKIHPQLSQQEERVPFDIHQYGDRIVSALNTVGQRRSFSSIVSGLDNFEACKFLLASLQLANDNTVAIDSVDGLDESLDSMALTLISTQRATDRFKSLPASTMNTS